MNVGLLAAMGFLGLGAGPTLQPVQSFVAAQPPRRVRSRRARYSLAANSRVKSLKQEREERRAIRDRQNALELKFKLDQQQRAKVAGCSVRELHNKKNRWVLNDAKFNAALQA